jgi:hypothetical protein
MGEQAGFRVDLKQPGFGGRDIEPPRHKRRDDGHGVAVFQQRVWLERRNAEFHRKTVFHEGDGHKSKPVEQARPIWSEPDIKIPPPLGPIVESP